MEFPASFGFRARKNKFSRQRLQAFRRRLPLNCNRVLQ
jgi:hypothetical protein